MSRAEFYRLVSSALRLAKPQSPGAPAQQFERDVTALQLAFERHNTMFDGARFRRDCGL